MVRYVWLRCAWCVCGGVVGVHGVEFVEIHDACRYVACVLKFEEKLNVRIVAMAFSWYTVSEDLPYVICDGKFFTWGVTFLWGSARNGGVQGTVDTHYEVIATLFQVVKGLAKEMKTVAMEVRACYYMVHFTTKVT